LIFKIIKPLGFNIIAAIKIFEFLIVFLSGIFMYKLVYKIFKNKNSALISSLVYICSPYFLTDVFARMAYSEISVFLFTPIIMISLYYIFNKNYKKFSIYFTIGYVGMINSHLVLTLYFTIFVAIILLINIKKILNKKAIIAMLCSTIIVLLITSSFWVPLLEHKIKGDYVVFVKDEMMTYDKIQTFRLDLENHINKGYKDELEVYTSSIVIILCLYTIFNINKYAKDKMQLSFIISIISIVAIFISTVFFKFKWVPNFLLNIQFPWRVCAFLCLATSILAGAAINNFNKSNIQIIIIIVALVCMSDINYVFSNYDLTYVNGVSFEDASSIKKGGLGWHKEYLPVKARENLEYLLSKDQEVLIKSGNAKIDIINNKTPLLEFNINTKEKTIIEIPRLFYFGYDIKLKNNDNQIIKIQYKENENGFIEFEIPESGNITVDYNGTILNKIANVTSSLTVIGVIIFLCINNKKIKS